MRILFLNAHYHPHIGGVEIFTRRLANALTGKGHTVAVAASRYPAEAPLKEMQGEVAVHRFPFLEALSQRGLSPSERLKILGVTMRDFGALKAGFRPDVVHVNLTDANPFFHLRTLHPACATVVTFHGPLSASTAEKPGVVSGLLAEADVLTTVSQATAEAISAATGTPSGNIAVIPPGVPPATFPDQTTRRPGPATFLIAGRLSQEKGVDVAVAAVAQLENVRLIVVGEGPEMERLRLQAASLGIADVVSFLGPVPNENLAPLLSAADAVLVPSREESYGIIAAEAATAGKVVIASAVGGLREIVVPEETGLLVPPQDSAALAAAMGRIASDRAFADRLGSAARSRAEAHFSFNATLAAYVSIYERCTAARIRHALSHSS